MRDLELYQIEGIIKGIKRMGLFFELSTDDIELLIDKKSIKFIDNLYKSEYHGIREFIVMNIDSYYMELEYIELGKEIYDWIVIKEKRHE